MTAETDLAWRTANVGRLLFNATDRSVRIKMLHVVEAGFGDVSEAQVSLYQNMDMAGTRLIVLAERTGLTKSSITELVARAETLGLLARRGDPSDARAKIVAFTQRGESMMRALHEGMMAVEREVRVVLGDSELNELKAALICASGAVDVRDDQFHESWRAISIGRLFALSARSFAQNVLQNLRMNGHQGISEGMLTLFRNLDMKGTRLTDISSRARMTKQAMREQVDRAERLELIARQPDPRDQRAKIILLTAQGYSALDAMRRGVAAAEQQLQIALGKDPFMQLKRMLATIDHAQVDDWRAATA